MLGLVALLACASACEAYEIQEFALGDLALCQADLSAADRGRVCGGRDAPADHARVDRGLAGSNTVLANLVGVLFGVFMYFPTLVEVPIAKLFLSLGMHRGPLLAYLMADPELSLQSILITASIIGKLKAWVYVAWVALFSTLAGLLYGAWVDGTSLGCWRSICWRWRRCWRVGSGCWSGVTKRWSSRAQHGRIRRV